MKTETIRFRVATEEKDRLVATAEKAGLSLSDYIRAKVFPQEADKQAKDAIDARPIVPQARTYRNGDEGLIQEEMRRLTHRIPVSYQRRAAAIQNLKKEGKLG